MKHHYYRCRECGHVNMLPAVSIKDDQRITCIRCGYSAPFYQWKPYRVAKTGKRKKKRRR